MHPAILPLLLGCAGSEPVDSTPRVVVLVLDGVRAEDSFGDGTSTLGEGTAEDLMPQVWQELVPRGALATDAGSWGVTVTAPAHTVLLSGQHGPYANYGNDHGVGSYRPDHPQLTEVVRRDLGLAQSRVLLTGNTALIEGSAASRHPAYGLDCTARWRLVGESRGDSGGEKGVRDDEQVFEALREELVAHQPVLTVANLHQTDRLTHNGELPDYADNLRELDSRLVSFWDWLQQTEGYAGQTWLFLLADHGRHTEADTSPPWRHHGDSCRGCRSVPWLVLGPDVRAGTTVSRPLGLEDTAATIAALLGVALPHGRGRIVAEAFDRSLPEEPAGLVSAAGAGDAVAELHHTGDPSVRFRLTLAGVEVPLGEPLAVSDAAVAADGDTTWLCTRSLTPDPDGTEEPWVHRCGQLSDGTWRDLAVPWTATLASSQPQLLPDGQGGLRVLAADNPTGAAAGNSTNPIGLWLATWDGAEWTTSTVELSRSFPTGPAGIALDDGLRIVFAAGDAGADDRDARTLHRIDHHPDEGWGSPVVLALESPEDPWTLERPALGRAEDGALILAALGHGETRSALVLTTSADDGESWGPQTTLFEPAPLPQLTPQVVDGGVVYGAWQDGEARVCTVAPGEPAPSCAGTGAKHLQAILALEDGLQIVAWDGDRWDRRAL